MQGLIVLPQVLDENDADRLKASISRKVATVPLLLRLVATAARSGVSSVLIVHPERLRPSWLREQLSSERLSSVSVDMVSFPEGFDPDEPAHWRRIEERLEAKFLWLPWSYVTTKRWLAPLVELGGQSRYGACMEAPAGEAPGKLPAVVDKAALLEQGGMKGYLAMEDLEVVSYPYPAGIHVTSARGAKEAVGLLVRGSGKPSDGIHSKFNRWFCRPLVRALLPTPVSPNMVTWSGIPLVALSGYAYAQGHWGAYVAGALAYFASVLVDEIDGMLARTKLQESPFGCWLETFVDYLSYLFLWSGFSIGLYRQYGSPWWPSLGVAVMVMNVLTFIVLAQQRKSHTPADRPETYQKRFYGRLEADSNNFISRIIRLVVAFPKRGVMSHYIVLFSFFNIVHVLFGFVILGATLSLLVSLYMNRLFRIPVVRQPAGVKS